MSHWCFTCNAVSKDDCKDAKHDVDYEDLYQTLFERKAVSLKQDRAEFHAMVVESVSKKMARITPLVYLEKEDNFYYWNHKAEVWQNDGMSLLMTLFNGATPRIMPYKQKVFHDCVFQLKLDVVRLPKNFRPNPKKLYFKNCALNLETLQPDFKNKDDNIQIILDTDLDMRAAPPKAFLDALRMALPDPQELYDCLQALSSVLLVRTQRIEKAFFFLGSGGNGKSTIMKCVDNIFREYIAHVDMLDLQKDGFSKTALVDKLANSFSEISKIKQKDVGVFKAIATGEIQSINGKYKDRYDAIIKVIQFYSSNQMPEIEDVNEGFIRRAHPIEFNQRIKVKDPYIDDKLNTDDERKKILTLLIKIARVTKQYGFLFEKTMEEKASIIIKQTHPILGFINAGIVQRNPKYTIKKKELHQIYTKFCKEKGYQPVNPIAFSKFLTKEGFLYGGRNEDPHWIGIGFPPKTEGQKILDNPVSDVSYQRSADE